MTRWIRVLAAGLNITASSGLAAQAPTIDKVDPPSWWGNSTINPVRLLIHGKNLNGASFVCPKLACTGARVSANGTYAFVDVNIPKSATPGSYPLTLKTTNGSASVPFTVAPTLATTGRFQGFGVDDAVYLIMPDRFVNGDASNDNGATPGMLDRKKGRYYHGGDLAGVQQKLPYLKSLGITAIWLNPLYDNANRLNEKEKYDGQAITDYHGYGAVDFYNVDEHFGTVTQFKQLVDAAHAQGIKIILDMVANHTGPYHPWATNPPTPTWFHGTVEKHPNNTWQTWTLADPYASAELKRATLDGWFIDILPDLNQDDPDVARYIIQNTLWWISVSGMDGIRQDTWPYVPRTFWRDWMTAIKRQYPKVRVVGEVLDGDASQVSFFEGGRKQYDGVDDMVDMLFDYPMHFAMRNAFAQGHNIRDVAQMLSRDHVYRDAHHSMLTLFGSHDVLRFMNEPGATLDGLKLAYTMLFTIRGTPMVYYGDEIALPGGSDPDNRRDFPGGFSGDAKNAFDVAGRTKEQQMVWSHVQTLLKLRASRPALRAAATEHLVETDQQFVYRRGKTVVVLNNATTATDVTIPVASLGKDVLGVCGTAVKSGTGVTLKVPARSGCIF